MRIGVDVRPLQNNNRFRGIGRYLENVLRSLAPLVCDDTMVFYVEKGSIIPRDVIDLFKKSETRFVTSSKVKRIKYVRSLARLYKKVSVKTGDVDVFFQGDPWLGIPKNVPTVATFFDLIPMVFKNDKELLALKGIKKYKQFFGKVVQDKFYKEMLDSYHGAKAIIAISQSSKDDFLYYIDQSAENKISVTYLAGSDGSFPKVTAISRSKVREKYGLSNSPFLLYVGGIDSRKNITGLAKDFIELKKEYKDLKMVMAGKEFSLKRNLSIVGWLPLLNKHSEEAKDILTPGFVPDDELAVLYAEAAAFPFPSLYEGFGLPILEAMHLGCPVICYDNSSLPEVTGTAAILVKSGESLVPAIKKILDEPKLRASLVIEGKKQAAKFNWGITAKETLKLIKRTARDN